MPLSTRSETAPAPQTAAWRPLLTEAADGTLRRNATGALEAILADLPSPGSGPDLDASLAGGWAGLALLFAYLDRAWPEMGWKTKAQEALEAAISQLGSQVVPPGLYSGFAGVAWTMAHFERRFVEASEEDPNQDIDEALLGYLDQSPWSSDYDLISGLAGFGVYALDRTDRASGRELLGKVVARLDETKVQMDGGLTWFTPPHLLPPWQRELNPEGYYTLGLAQGVPEVLVVLARAAAAGRTRAGDLLEGAVAWLLAQRNPHGSPSCYATVLPAGGQPRNAGPSRVAWCYGDLGVAVALLVVAREAGRPDWELHALHIARTAAAIPPARAGVRDGGLCHGAAGNAHLFSRLHQATGEPVFQEAALAYLEQLLALRREGRGIGGFEAWMPGPEDGTDPWQAVPGLLEGAAGIGLALVSALHPVAPDWDRFLLADIPPAPPAVRPHRP